MAFSEGFGTTPLRSTFSVKATSRVPLSSRPGFDFFFGHSLALLVFSTFHFTFPPGTLLAC